MIKANVIESAHKASVDRLLFLGSSCIYPKFGPQPLQEDSLLTGALEETNPPYARPKSPESRCVAPTTANMPGAFWPRCSAIIDVGLSTFAMNRSLDSATRRVGALGREESYIFRLSFSRGRFW
jgi:hypothetical protein